MSDQPAILVEGLIVHRTPSMRSLRFHDVQARDLWVDSWGTAYLVIPVMFLLLAGAKLIGVEDEVMLWLVAAVISLGLLGTSAATGYAWWATRGRVEVLSWEMSAALDGRPIEHRTTLGMGVGALVCSGITGAALWFVEWNELYWRHFDDWALALFYTGLVGFVTLALVWETQARLRYGWHLRKLEGGG